MALCCSQLRMICAATRRCSGTFVSSSSELAEEEGGLRVEGRRRHPEDENMDDGVHKRVRWERAVGEVGITVPVISRLKHLAPMRTREELRCALLLQTVLRDAI